MQEGTSSAINVMTGVSSNTLSSRSARMGLCTGAIMSWHRLARPVGAHHTIEMDTMSPNTAKLLVAEIDKAGELQLLGRHVF